MKKMLTLNVLIIIVLSSCKNDPPTASFEVTKKKAYIGESITFTSSSEGADSYSWDFGDNETSTEMNPTHKYNTGGPKTVVLTVTNKAGNDNFIDKVNIYNGKSSYQVKNASSMTLVLASYYYDGDDILDFVMHGSMTSGKISDTTYTSRNVINLGGTMLGETFIVTSDYAIKENQHNILEVNNSTPIFSGSPDFKSGDILLKKLDYIFNK